MSVPTTENPWVFTRCRVTDVVDGDTVDLEIDLGFLVTTRLRARLHSINTPERGHPGWAAARDRLIELVLNKPVVVHSRKPRDKYGRFLATLFVDGQDINALLVQEGLAVEYLV